MIVYIEAPGEPDVGIPSKRLTVDGLEPEGYEDREYMRAILTDCFMGLLDDDVSVWFEGEMDEK